MEEKEEEEDVVTWEWKTNSGRSTRCMVQTQTSPSGSLTARGFLLYDATLNSGNCSDQQ
jgi:hypothetical protein